MQKSKNITIAIIILMLIYGLLANLKLVFNINAIYLYIINPLFWITLAVFLKIAIGKSYQKSRIKKEVIQYILIAVIIYILTYMISGLFITFGNNPYFTTVKGFLINLWMFGTVIISKEYIRYRLINNVYENDKKEIEVTNIDFAKFICNNKNYNVYKLINKDELKSYVETVWLNHKVPLKEFFTFIDWDRLIIDCGNIVSFDTKEENEVDKLCLMET